MAQQKEILKQIKRYVGPFEKEFLYGACWLMFAYLKRLYPQAEPWYDFSHGHIYARIDGVCYDAKGALVGIPEGCAVRCFHAMDENDPDHRRTLIAIQESSRKMLAQMTHFETHITSMQ